MAETEASAAGARGGFARGDRGTQPPLLRGSRADHFSDREYDRLYRELVDLEKRFPQLAIARFADAARRRRAAQGFLRRSRIACRCSVSTTPIPKKRSAHFYRRMERLLPNEKIPVVIEPKVDGVAVSLLYENGRAPLCRHARRRNGRRRHYPKYPDHSLGAEAS